MGIVGPPKKRVHKSKRWRVRHVRERGVKVSGNG